MLKRSKQGWAAGFEAEENCAVLGYYAASSGNSLPTFQDNLSTTSSKVKKFDP